MHDERDRRQVKQDRADRQVIEQAAAQLRTTAIRDGYAGMEHKHLAFALALVLDELARHVRGLDSDLRASVLDGCRSLLGQMLGPGWGPSPWRGSGYRRCQRRPVRRSWAASGYGRRSAPARKVGGTARRLLRRRRSTPSGWPSTRANTSASRRRTSRCCNWSDGCTSIHGVTVAAETITFAEAHSHRAMARDNRIKLDGELRPAVLAKRRELEALVAEELRTRSART